MSKKNAQVYIRAAKLIESGNPSLCCFAIARTDTGSLLRFDENPFVKKFDALFSKSGDSKWSYTSDYLSIVLSPAEARNLRSWMLLLMAAIEEAE